MMAKVPLQSSLKSLWGAIKTRSHLCYGGSTIKNRCLKGTRCCHSLAISISLIGLVILRVFLHLPLIRLICFVKADRHPESRGYMAEENIFGNRIQRRKRNLARYLRLPMQEVAAQALLIWPDREELEEVFEVHPVMHKCNQLYVVDESGRQISSMFDKDGKDESSFGTDRSHRPYMCQAYEAEDMILSSLYINRSERLSCITAMMPVRRDEELYGYICAEFTLLSLPSEKEYMEDRRVWLQVKGDPSIRSTLFMQSRTKSAMDEQLDDVIQIVEELLTQRGVFHLKLHFSSSRATVWLYDDPYRYRVNILDELLDAAFAYPPRPYPEEAVVSPEEIRQCFHHFKTLREADDTLYLRAGGLNIINGMVSLNFSCDGSHYMPAEEFLEKGEVFWLGNAGTAVV